MAPADDGNLGALRKQIVGRLKVFVYSINSFMSTSPNLRKRRQTCKK